MRDDHRVLAVVPARSGSKGIPDKNMQPIAGASLIAWAARCLAELDWLDASVISTDSPAYAREAEAHGLRAPFLRPDELASDTAGAVDTITHALLESERLDGVSYDIVLIIEPTSPLRMPSDIERCTDLLIEREVGSVIAVSVLPSKYHPHKVFSMQDGAISFYEECGAAVVNRQELGELYWRNGVCYALSRSTLLERRRIVDSDTLGVVIDRPVVNIDEPLELVMADHLMRTELASGERRGGDA